MTVDLIVWDDAHSVDDWSDLSGLSINPYRVVTVGLVVKEDDRSVAVAAGWCVPDDVCSVLIIPRGMIVRRETVMQEEAVAAIVKGLELRNNAR